MAVFGLVSNTEQALEQAEQETRAAALEDDFLLKVSNTRKMRHRANGEVMVKILQCKHAGSNGNTARSENARKTCAVRQSTGSVSQLWMHSA